MLNRLHPDDIGRFQVLEPEFETNVVALGLIPHVALDNAADETVQPFEAEVNSGPARVDIGAEVGRSVIKRFGLQSGPAYLAPHIGPRKSAEEGTPRTEAVVELLNAVQLEVVPPQCT
mmetsp:Transcript_6518/g.12010  ORF Transcript_6518/g.12010 Transcript_6518/m.12010 type:complete len:118 (+) Transcript_6518:924-1277(+)